MTTEYAARKNEEAYDHVFILHHPDEERPACRPLRTAPCYDRMKARGAQFGVVNGFERPNYFGPLDAPENFDHDARSFRRGGWWQYAVEEARAIRENVGLIDATAFTKHIVRGPGATAFLDWFTTNKLPKVGRINLTYALTGTGTTRTEYTIQRQGRARLLPRLRRRLDRLRRRLPPQGRRGQNRRFRPDRDPRRHHATRRLRPRRPQFPRAPRQTHPRRRPRHRPLQQALPLALRPPRSSF